MNIMTKSRFNALQNAGMTVCPFCRRDLFIQFVTNTSIFDIDVKICQRCAITEKSTPKFNWIKETKYDKNNFLSGDEE